MQRRHTKRPTLLDSQIFRVELEVGQRAAVGGVFIFLAFLAFRIFTPFPDSAAFLRDLLGAGIGFATLSRLILVRLQTKYAENLAWRVRWRTLIRGVSLLLALCWGLLSILTYKTFGISMPFFTVTIINFGIGTIALHNLGLDLVLVRSYLPLIVGLPILSFVIWPQEGQTAIVVGLVLYVVYLMFLAGKAHALTWEAMENRNLIQAQRDQLTAVLDAIPGYVFWTDPAGNYLGMNRKLREALGQSSEELIGKRVHSPAEFSVFLNSGEKERLIETLFSLRNNPHAALVAMKKYRSGTETDVVVIALDIEDRQRAQRELEEARAKASESARLAALGTMAAGIAHEINNPLQVIRSLAQLLQNPPEKFSMSPNEMASRIDKTAQRIARIISGLRAFARPGTADPIEHVNLGSLLSEVVELARISRPAHDIAIEITHLPKDLWIDCRRTEIGQVLINLINNALDAVEQLPERWVRVSVFDFGDTVEIRVTDSGKGIPASIADKIMLPFFTTKLATSGIGLGLSISASILERHHGSLSIDKKSPNTCFVITLPKRERREQVWQTLF